ncbi:transposase [Klebsiella pneumoniae]|nr:transposase [Klebsiella pneumoniae]
MPAFEWVHVQLHQQKGMISLSPPTICNSANKTAHEVQTRWLESRQPNERNGNEAEKFSDECWKNGLRLDKIPSVHYQLLIETIRWTLIPRQK